MDGMTAAEVLTLANLLVALARDADVISDIIEKHIAARRAMRLAGIVRNGVQVQAGS